MNYDVVEGYETYYRHVRITADHKVSAPIRNQDTYHSVTRPYFLETRCVVALDCHLGSRLL
jgi:hypothetical protein